jgi:hypothetical protein
MLRCGAEPKQAIAALREAAAIATRHGNVVHELRAETALLDAVRHHDDAAVSATEQTLAVACNRLPADSQLAEVRVARAALSSPR